MAAPRVLGLSLVVALMLVCVFSELASAKPKSFQACCKVKKYKQCYMIFHTCPSNCPDFCEVDCVTCKPVCNCDKPGAVCQDPRFIGGDGVTFYFHGKKDSDFCLVADSNLHINAHFIGKRNESMKRDFTWVQSIAILHGTHQIYVGANKVAKWVDSVDHLTVLFDGAPITLEHKEGAKWVGPSGLATITRTKDTNSVVLEVEGSVLVTANAVPISEEESRIHGYGVEEGDNCLAHLDLGFKFNGLSQDVDGVLGQTYREEYRSPVKIGAAMPVMGGTHKFSTSSLFAADCAVAKFQGVGETGGLGLMQQDNGGLGGSMSCTSGLSGRGIVCKK